MSEETRRILDLLAQGKITVDEADQLLRALTASHADPAPPPKEPAATSWCRPGASAPGTDAPGLRYLRIAVHKAANQYRPEKQFNIRVPLALVRSGMRLGAIIPGYAGDAITRQLRERGIDVDLSKLDQAELENLLKNLGELTVDVDKGKAQVRITCE
jgi:hypothetical protein